MAKIFVPTTGPEDWRRLLADPIKHWKRGHSAMATALSWESAQGLPKEIAAILGEESELLLAIPEHKVPLPGGIRDSQCDVFALVRTENATCALAVEAKVNEPFGPTIGEWTKESSEGRHTRLKAICNLLGANYPPSSELRYQLFHRAAAAAIEASRFNTDRSAMIIHSFSQDHRWFDDFSAFCEYLGIKAAKATPLSRVTADGRAQVLGWATGDPNFT